MHAQRSGPPEIAVRFRYWKAAGCTFAVLVPLVLGQGRSLHAQQPTSPATASAGAASPATAAGKAAADETDQDTVNTTPQDELNDDGNPADRETEPVVITAPPLPGSNSTAPAAVPVIVTVIPASAGGDVRRQQINNECANLLMLANALQVEVDKSTKDELSVAVVRKAGQIEQLARKVRDDMKPVLSTKNSGGRP